MVKKEKKLIIVESPNKVKSIKAIVGPEYTVMASVGHISEIRNSGIFNMGIDVANEFKADYVISNDKKDIVKKLKQQVDESDIVYLASDPDREGEAIAYFLKKFLKISDSKYQRVTFHEITKNAVLKALENPRKIDMDLVAASLTRQKLDKIVGYRLSPIAYKNLKAKSVGRCQSAGLKLVVEKEEEIRKFRSEKYFDLFLYFEKNSNTFKAKYVGTDEEEIKQISSLDKCLDIINSCKNNIYSIGNIEYKEIYENPKPPFITSSFQQEVSKKLGISVKESMSIAQKLFEGIEINNQHIALITYIRTDSTDLAPEFLPILEEYVKDKYGQNYFSPIKKLKKSELTQDGHEAIRPVDLEMTPEKLSNYIDDEKLLKVYSMIYKRTIASSMKPALINNTIYSIYNGKNKFIMNSKELIFDGYRKVYNYKDETNDEEELVKETFTKGEKLEKTYLEYAEKQTQPPKRYNESSFIKELDKRGIGRPSTFATILNTIMSKDRGYCESIDKFIQPTEKGILLSHFLDNSFPDIVNLNYTVELEKDLDEISKGKMDSIDFLVSFYSKLEKTISNIDAKNQTNEVCPKCGKNLVLKKGPYGEFLGCSGYPQCKYIKSRAKVEQK